MQAGSPVTTLLLTLSGLAAGSLTMPAAFASEQSFFADTPMVIGATRLQQPLSQVPASVSIITRQMIRDSGYREIPDLLRLVPGFVVGHYSGHEPVVTYLGLGGQFSREIQVLVDGRSVYIPTFGGVPWSSLPLLIDDIEKIEVIRGPNSAAYGANAFLAIINISTRDAAEDPGGRVRYTGSGGSNSGIEDFYASFGGNLDKFDWRLSAGKQGDAGFRNEFDSEHANRINWRSEYALDYNQTLNLQLGFANNGVQRGEADASGDSNGDGLTDSVDIMREEDGEYRFFHLEYRYEGIDNSTSIRWFRNQDKVIDNYLTPRLNEVFAGNFSSQPAVAELIRQLPLDINYSIDFDRQSTRDEIEIERTHNFGETLRWVYGGNLRKDQVQSFFLFNDRETHSQDLSRLFTHLEWHWHPDWLLNLGASVEDTDLTESQFSPRLALVYLWNPQQSLRFSYTEAVRNPILYEQQGRTEFVVSLPDNLPFPLTPFSGLSFNQVQVVNHAVKPEQIQTFEIGLNSRSADNTWESDLKYSNSELSEVLYTKTVNDSQVDQVDGFYLAYENNSHIDIHNLEWATSYRASALWDLNTGISITDAEGNSQALVESIPHKVAHIMLGVYPAERHRLHLLLRYLGSLSWTDTSNNQPASRNLDLQYEYRLPFVRHTKLSLTGQNLLENNNDYLSENYHNKVWYLSLSTEF